MNLLAPFRRLLARWRLRRAGYCTRHLIQKKTLSERLHVSPVRVLAGDHIEDYGSVAIASSCMDRLDHYRTYCELCEEEKAQRDQAKLDSALTELGGKLK
jgi:hypothetical protein